MTQAQESPGIANIAVGSDRPHIGQLGTTDQSIAGESTGVDVAGQSEVHCIAAAALLRRAAIKR